MELKIDPEFKSLIPPQSKEEHGGLENSICDNRFDPAYPIIVWDGYIVDGHNRYEICRKHGIEYQIAEKDFPNRTDAYNWIIDNQLSRRNLKPVQYSYLRGKKKDDLKNKLGDNVPSFNKLNRASAKKGTIECHNDTLNGQNITESEIKDTSTKIADKDNVSRRTVFRDAQFAKAVDTIAENACINAQDLLAGNLGKITKKDITKVAEEKNPEQQKKLIEKLKETGNIKEAKKKVKTEEILEKINTIILPEPIKLINADFIDIYPTIEKESVDFIITDPPYPEKYLPLYETGREYPVRPGIKKKDNYKIELK